MNITLKTEYALRALYELLTQGRGKPVTRRQIADSQGISAHFLEKIFIDLQKKDLIKSVRGPGGGFILTRSPGEITLWDIYTAVDDPDYHESNCYRKAGDPCANRDHCKVKFIWFKFSRDLKRNMTNITLADVLDK